MTNLAEQLEIEDLTKTNILLVEDEERILLHLNDLISGANMRSQSITNFNELRLALESTDLQFDVVILDRLLHGQDSAHFISKIKQAIPNVKIIVLSAINSPAEKVSVLDAGADDYVSKPFDGEELIARIRVMLRKADPQVCYGNLIINIQNRTIKVGNIEENLTNKEFSLLYAMIKQPRKVFTKSDFYEKVWAMRADVESNVVETTINKIRKRLDELGSTAKIKNKRNVGYWIEE